MRIINGINTAEDVARFLEQARPADKGGWQACCPAHEDRSPSLSIHDGDKGIVVHCHAGCDQKNVIQALRDRGAWPVYERTEKKKTAGQIVATYDYVTSEGELLFQVVRFNPKDFRQRCSDPETGTWKWSIKHIKQLVPYNLPAILKMKITRQLVICEGEKDADNLMKIGVVATTFAQGAGKWRTEYAQWFQGRAVVILPDNDEPGEEHAQLVANRLHGVAASIKIVRLPGLPPKGDVSDWLQQAGSTKEALANIIRETDVWSPPKKPEPEQREVITQENRAPAVNDPSMRWTDWPDNVKGKPLSTIRNIEKLLNDHGVIVRYNVIKKDIEVSIPNRSFTVDNHANCSMSELVSMAAAERIPTGNVPEFVAYLADRNPYNPVAQWIESKPWDGTNRFPSLVLTLDPDDITAAGALLWRWMLSAVAAVYSPSGVAAGGALVLQGDQYIGKTSWFWRLVNSNRDWGKEGALLNPADRDSVMQCLQYWIVELGELDATFRKADVAALKSFLVRDYDQLRKPYARGDSKFPRRTVFCASVNPREYLHDDTGNRRYWTIACGQKMNPRHEIDMQQMWAQVKAKWDEGARHMLTKDEVMKLNERNDNFMVRDPIEDIIGSTYEWDLAPDRRNTEDKTATQVLLEIGYDRPTKAQKNAASAALKKLTGAEARRSTGGKRVYAVPQKVFKLNSQFSQDY